MSLNCRPSHKMAAYAIANANSSVISAGNDIGYHGVHRNIDDDVRIWCAKLRTTRLGARRQERERRMPVSVANSQVIYDALRACDVRIISALPETWLVHLIRMAEEDPAMTLVRLAKEEEGVGISAGAHLAGVNSAMLMQNHGFLAAINPLVSLALLYRIPLLLLISYRGHMGEKDPWQTQGGNVTEPLLRALGIPYFFLDGVETVGKRIRQAQTLG